MPESIILDQVLYFAMGRVASSQRALCELRDIGDGLPDEMVQSHADLAQDVYLVDALRRDVDTLPPLVEVRTGGPTPCAWEVIPMAHPSRLEVRATHRRAPVSISDDEVMALVREVASRL